jgi:hypothetical protein
LELEEDAIIGARIAAFTNWRPATGEALVAYAERVRRSRRACACGNASSHLVLESCEMLSGHGYPQVRCRHCGSVRPHLGHAKWTRTDPAHGIYFIESGKGGPIKVGWAKDSVSERLTILQTGNPEHLNLVGVVVGDVQAERALHRVLGWARIRGEWFAREPALRVLDRLRRGLPLDDGR